MHTCRVRDLITSLCKDLWRECDYIKRLHLSLIFGSKYSFIHPSLHPSFHVQSPLSHSRDILSLCHLHLCRQLNMEEGDTALWSPTSSHWRCGWPRGIEQMQRPSQHLPGCCSLLHSARPEVEPEQPEHLPANGATVFILLSLRRMALFQRKTKMLAWSAKEHLFPN